MEYKFSDYYTSSPLTLPPSPQLKACIEVLEKKSQQGAWHCTCDPKLCSLLCKRKINAHFYPANICALFVKKKKVDLAQSFYFPIFYKNSWQIGRKISICWKLWVMTCISVTIWFSLQVLRKYLKQEYSRL